MHVVRKWPWFDRLFCFRLTVGVLQSNLMRRRIVPDLPKLPKLGKVEMAVLEYLWGTLDTDVREAHLAVGKRRGISVNTVGSALDRLYKKGLLTREKVSHAYRYQAAINRESFRARRVVEAAGGLQALSKSGLLAAFVDLVGDSDGDALAELERLTRLKREETGS